MGLDKNQIFSINAKREVTFILVVLLLVLKVLIIHLLNVRNLKWYCPMELSVVEIYYICADQ